MKSFVHIFFLTFGFFAVNLCFNSSITRFIPSFFTLYLAFSSVICLFTFPPLSSHLSLFSLLISLLRLETSLSVLLFDRSSFLSPLLPFFTPDSVATQKTAAIGKFVCLSYIICLDMFYYCLHFLSYISQLPLIYFLVR